MISEINQVLNAGHKVFGNCIIDDDINIRYMCDQTIYTIMHNCVCAEKNIPKYTVPLIIDKDGQEYSNFLINLRDKQSLTLEEKKRIAFMGIIVYGWDCVAVTDIAVSFSAIDKGIHSVYI